MRRGPRTAPPKKEHSREQLNYYELISAVINDEIFQTLSEDTHSQLKKNVYENYGQFMTTAKEIAFLESEMYQLSHMITEQRNILQAMAETSMLGDKVPLTHEIDETQKTEESGSKTQQDEKKT